MDTHRSVEISRQIYARLLFLYPAGHRAAYGADMLQLFTDQCRAAARAGKRLSFVGLWLRTLVDLFVSALREHVTSPHSWPGLLEAVPNKPLPWGGVALVLLPGLIFFVAQVAQLTGQDWFFLLTYRAAYFMILPVLVIWVWKRKFPILGLMPLGLLFKTGLEIGYRLQFLGVNRGNPFIGWLVALIEPLPSTELRMIVCALLMLIILVLLWLAGRRAGTPAAAWGGLAAYVLLVTFLSYHTLQQFWEYNPVSPNMPLSQQRLYAFDLIYYQIFNYGGLLVLILLGALLAHRHGRLAILLPLGYLMPTVIYGRISNNWPGLSDPNFTFMLSVSATALAYRFLVTLAGPLWVVRSASGEWQRRAGAISLLALVGIQVTFNLTILLTGVRGPDLWNSFVNLITPQLLLAAAAALALALYRPLPGLENAKEVPAKAQS